MPGLFKEVNGYQWPISDLDCMAVVFNRVTDLEIAMRYVSKHTMCVQAGGNCGVWPNWLASHFDYVYTFEPEHFNFACLVANCTKRNIIKSQLALGNMRGNIAVRYPEGLSNLGACAIGGVGPIPILRLDDLMLPACDFIQLDIEGYEYDAVKGAWRTIQLHHPVLMLEDKGLSVEYGKPKGWPAEVLEPIGYKQVDAVERDVIWKWQG